MLCQPCISPPASHYHTLHTVLQHHPPAIKSPWHVFFKLLGVLFWFLRYLPCSFLIAHQYSISPICMYLSILPLFPPSLPSAPAEAHPHTGHSSSAAGPCDSWCCHRALSLLTWAVLLAHFVVSVQCLFLRDSQLYKNTNESNYNPQPEEGEAINHIVQMGKLQQS